jgi:hypothetical protein
VSSYAKATNVSVQQSRADIQSVLARFGAVFDGYVDEPGRVIVNFHGHNRWVRFVIHPPPRIDPQGERALWRALYLGIKGKLVCVAEGIETFEQAFYAHLVTQDDQILSEGYKPPLKTLPDHWPRNS